MSQFINQKARLTPLIQEICAIEEVGVPNDGSVVVGITELEILGEDNIKISAEENEPHIAVDSLVSEIESVGIAHEYPIS